MNLIEELEADVKEAMLARDEERRDALRLILASLRSAEKDLLRPLSEDEELQVLQREPRGFVGGPPFRQDAVAPRRSTDPSRSAQRSPAAR